MEPVAFDIDQLVDINAAMTFATRLAADRLTIMEIPVLLREIEKLLVIDQIRRIR